MVFVNFINIPVNVWAAGGSALQKSGIFTVVNFGILPTADHFHGKKIIQQSENEKVGSILEQNHYLDEGTSWDNSILICVCCNRYKWTL